MRPIKDPKKPNVTRAYPAYSEAGYRLPGQYQIPLDPETGEQIPILLPEATVYDDNAALAGLQDVVSGSTFGQLARQYRTPQSMYDQARMVSQVGQEMTGVPGAMRTINRVFGEGTVSGDPLFVPPANASTLDKVLDATDIIGAALPLVGPASRYGMRAVKSGVKAGVNAALSPEALKAADKLLKPNPSRGFSGGLISRANLPSDFKSNLTISQIDARNAEVKAVKDQYNDLINNAPTMEEKSRLIEEQDKAAAAVEKRHNKDSAVAFDALEKLSTGKALDPEETDLIYGHLSNMLREKIPQINKPSDAINDWTLRSYSMSAANRGVQAMADKPVVGDALKLLARKFMEHSGGATEVNIDDVAEFASNPMKILKSEPKYNGTVFKKDHMPDKGPNIVKAYIEGDFTGLKPNTSTEADEFVRTAFKQQFDTYGDMNVVELPMIVGGTRENPLKIVEGKYGGWEDPMRVNRKSARENLRGIYSTEEKLEEALAMNSFTASTRVSNIFENVSNKVAGDTSSAYNVVINREGIPQSFQINAEDNNPFYPLIDVAGHQMKFELVSDDGINALYKVTSADVWKFTPDQYAGKWGVGVKDAIKMKQSAMLDAAGKPFVSVSENYVEIPTTALAKKNLVPGTY